MSDPHREDGEASSENDAQRPNRRFRPPLLAPHERYPDELVVDRVKLARSMDEHLDVLQAILPGDLYPLDLYVSGALQRSYHLVEGFLLAWDHWNVIVAAPLVRFQIDSLVRCAYLYQRRDSDAVVMEILRGTALRNLKDPASGKNLTDAHLVDLAGALYEWLPPVHAVSNEWVHLSERHVFNAWQAGDGRTLLGQFPTPVDNLPVSFWQELIGAMCRATWTLLDLGSGWADYKSSDEHSSNAAPARESESGPQSSSGAD